MSIRDLARELYRLESLVDELTLKLESAEPGENSRLQSERKQAILERDRYRAIMASKKESPPHGKTYV